MLTVRTQDLELLQTWFDDVVGARVRVAFPINKWQGAAASGAVYFEVEPGDHLETHTDSAEEILYIVAGEGDAHVGDERCHVAAGDLAVIPAMVPHGIKCVGSETLRVVGFFAEAEIVSRFERPVQPVGLSEMEQGAPAPAQA